MAWKWNKNVGLLLLAIWLIITSALQFVHFVAIDASLLAGLAIAAGVFILLGR